MYVTLGAYGSYPPRELACSGGKNIPKRIVSGPYLNHSLCDRHPAFPLTPATLCQMAIPTLARPEEKTPDSRGVNRKTDDGILRQSDPSAVSHF